MSLVHDKFFLNVTITDASGVNKSTLRYDLNYADWAALNTGIGAGDITGFLANINAVTDGLITGYSVGESFVEDTDVVGAAGSEIENVALVSCQIDGIVNKFATLRIPAPTDTLFLSATGSGRNVIDVADAALVAYLANFQAAGLCLLSDGEQIETVSVQTVKGKRIHRGSRKG
jgi:hypothetical protein